MSVYTFDWSTSIDDRAGYVIIRANEAHRATLFARREVRSRLLGLDFDIARIVLDLRREEPEAEQSREPEDSDTEDETGWVRGVEIEE